MSVNPTYVSVDCRTIAVSMAGRPHRNSTERVAMLRARRARQVWRDGIVGARGPQFTPVPKTGWRAKAAAKAALSEARDVPFQIVGGSMEPLTDEERRRLKIENDAVLQVAF